MGVKFGMEEGTFGMEEGTFGPLLHAKFHPIGATCRPMPKKTQFGAN